MEIFPIIKFDIGEMACKLNKDWVMVNYIQQVEI